MVSGSLPDGENFVGWVLDWSCGIKVGWYRRQESLLRSTRVDPLISYRGET